MNDLFSNAVASIEFGVLDFELAGNDAKRGLSATRNLYAGVLLLLKERLRRLDPTLISAQVEPKLDGGQVIWRGKGKNTADYQDLESRWKSLGLAGFDWGRLSSLRKVRNNVEHLYHAGTEAMLRQAVADTFLLVTELLRDHLGETPAQVFSEEAWEVLLHEATTQHALVVACRQSRSTVVGVPQPMSAIWDGLQCDDCGSELMRVKGGTTYPDVHLVCDACGAEPSTTEILSAALRDEYHFEWYQAVKDGEVDPLGACPECGKETYLISEDQCMLCLESRPYQRCIRCDEQLGLDEQDNSGLCGYCLHMAR